MKKTFEYQGKNSQGKNIKGVLKAENTKEVLEYIYKEKLVPLEIVEAKKKINLLSRDMIFPRKKVDQQKFSQMLRRFQILLGAGIPIMQCIGLLKEQTGDKGLSEDLKKIYEKIQEGGSLSEGMVLCEKSFPKLLVAMTKAGEESGELPDVLERMADYYENENRNAREIRGILYYPVILIAVALVVILFLLISVLPTFITLFETSEVPLPGVTLILLRVSDRLSKDWMMVLLILGGLGLMIKALVSLKEVKKHIDPIQLKLPIIGGYRKKKSLALFCYGLSMLQNSGVDLLSSLNLLTEFSENTYFKSEILGLLKKVAGGKPLSEGMEEHTFFPELLRELVEVGEKSGNLTDVLDKGFQIYEEETKEQMKAIKTILEPGLIVLIGGLVFFVLAAMMLPVFDLYVVYSSM